MVNTLTKFFEQTICRVAHHFSRMCNTAYCLLSSKMDLCSVCRKSLSIVSLEGIAVLLVHERYMNSLERVPSRGRKMLCLRRYMLLSSSLLGTGDGQFPSGGRTAVFSMIISRFRLLCPIDERGTIGRGERLRILI